MGELQQQPEADKKNAAAAEESKGSCWSDACDFVSAVLCCGCLCAWFCDDCCDGDFE